MTMRWLLFSAVAVSVGSGGCAISRDEEPSELRAAQRAQFIEHSLRDRESMSRTMIDRAIHERQVDADEASIDVLILSGGGDFGSFGAGVLYGWSKITDPAHRMPKFDIVSGVSTGALIAPLAYVGTPEALETAYRVYQEPKKDWFKQRGLLRFLFKQDALINNEGLVREVERTINADIIRQIAEGAEEDRILIIGTTNLDQGMQRMWNAHEEASHIVRDGADPRRLYDIIVASTSIPMAFPPVMIDGDLYVDGGVTRNIAYTTDMDYQGSVIEIWRREHAGEALPKIRFWVVINNQLSTAETTAQPAWTAMMPRTLELAIRSSTLASMKTLELAVRYTQADHDLDVEFRFIAIPDDWRAPKPGAFVKETMVSLAELGQRLGADPTSWRTRVPNPESPEDALETNGAVAGN